MKYALLLFTCLLLLLSPAGASGRRAGSDPEVATPRTGQLQRAAAHQAAYLTTTLRLHYGQARQVEHYTYRHLQQLDSLMCPLYSPALADSLLTNNEFLLGLAGEDSHYYQALSRVLTPRQYQVLLELEAPEPQLVQSTRRRHQPTILRQ